MATKKRLSAEGLLVAIEQLVGTSLAQQAAQSKRSSPPDAPEQKQKQDKGFHIPGDLVINEITGEITASNPIAVIFALVHPWLAVHHSEGSSCGNGEQMHETEYTYMLKIAESLLKTRE